MDIKAIVFDFDGVLADSEMLHLRVYNEMLAPAGVTLSTEEYCERYLGFDDEGADVVLVGEFVDGEVELSLVCCPLFVEDGGEEVVD